MNDLMQSNLLLVILNILALLLSPPSGQSYGKKVDWMDSENEEVEIWKKMVANPNSWVEAELPLRSSMTPRK